MATQAQALAFGETVERLPGEIIKLGSLMVGPLVSENLLGYAYLRWEEEELLPLIFYQGVPTLKWFLETYTKMPVIGCFRGEHHPEKLVGLGWLNTQVSGSGWKRAEVGMGFFRNVRPAECLALGRLMIQWAFEKLDLVAIYGSTPEPNRAAVLYARRLGFDMFGPVPLYAEWNGQPCGCWISTWTRSDWENKREGDRLQQEVL